MRRLLNASNSWKKQIINNQYGQFAMANPSSTQNIIIYITAVLAISALSLSVIQFFSSPKVAFVESNVLLAEYSESKQAREEINQRIQEWQANINTLNGELETLNTELVEQAEGWSTSKREEHLARMQQKQQELARYSSAVSQKATELETELMEPVYTSINNRIKAFGKERGYQIVFGTVQGGNILYGEDAINVTWDFINYLEGEQ